MRADGFDLARLNAGHAAWMASAPADDEDDGPQVVNRYRCPREGCGEEWADEWSCEVEDDCPKCGLHHITPYESEPAS